MVFILASPGGIPHRTCRFYCSLRGRYKETAFGFGILFWLHQGRIPHRTCRFYCCLAAHQRTRKKDSAEPSFPILWTPPHPPGGVSAAAGKCWLPRVYRDIGICIPVQIDNPQFGIWCSYLCSARYRSRFSRFRWAYVFRFSLLVGWTVRACGYVAFCYVLSLGLPLTAPFQQFCIVQVHFTNCAGHNHIVKSVRAA